jgi:hypothetical protein
VVALLSAGDLAAQTTRLTISGFNGSFGNSTVVIFDQGYDEGGSAVTFVVRNQASTAARTTNVYIVATSSTIGSHPISDVLWRRNDLVDWIPLSTTPALVESQVLAGPVGTTWTNSVWLRILYPWASSPNESLSAPVQFVLEVLPP